MAVRQLQRLEDRGLHMLSGTELEFRLFPADANIRDKDLKAAHETNNMYLPRHYRQYEKFYVEMDRRMRSLGIHFTTFHTEYGHGQLEMPLKPEWGILAADNLVRMKLLTHDTASDCGYRATFMPKPLLGQTGSGFHFNHSLWREKENVMLDEKDPKKVLSLSVLSVFQKLLFHAVPHRSATSHGTGSPANSTTALLSQRSSVQRSTVTAACTRLGLPTSTTGPSMTA